ncbi:mitochondrial import protein Pam17 [Ascobolus immersus RN42]|uniref:Presequence translocated-associated motor subunit PAM17 n=1 Tax=Ascobolus immersus RN42 TaxID=1160509 RepID=A0A3N4ILD3_ASCIM|nr:mitochondrial import protein Pam17 [Ascobolus immersus RN42]
MSSTRSLRPLTQSLRPLHTPLRTINPTAFLGLRNASTDSNNQTITTNASGNPQLTWDGYFNLRKSRRRINLVSSVFTATVATLSGGGYLSTLEFSAAQNFMGIDMPMVMGLATLAIGGVGWLCGPILGNGVWWSKVRSQLGGKQGEDLVKQKDRDFYHKLVKYRADPRMQSVSNPVPDYYGEKIGSVADFRRWMKDQKAYKKKVEKFV